MKNIFQKSFLFFGLFLIFLFAFSNISNAANIEASASRTSGVAPLSVHFNADLTASTPTERSFHDLEYSWNFGDSSSGNWGTDNKSKNQDKGPVSAHVYETPGEYVATLTVRNTNGVVAMETFNIIVDNPNIVFSGANTICISDSASNNFGGCPSGAQNIVTDSLVDMPKWITSNKRVLLHRGSTWSTSVALLGNTAVTKARLGAYGACINPDVNGICANAPQITSTLGTDAIFSLHYKNDFVIEDISFVASKYSNTSANVISGGKGLTKFLFLRNKVRGFYTGALWSHSRDEARPGSPTDMSVVACDIRDFYGYALYGGGENISILGNQFHNSDTTHISRIWWAYKGVYSHNMVSGSSLTNDQGRGALKLHGPKSTDSQALEQFPTKTAEVGSLAETGEGGLPHSTQYVVVADNVFGSSGPWPVTIRPQDDYSDERIFDVIFERNKLVQDFGNHSSRPWGNPLRLNGYYLTARNNIIDSSYSSTAANGIYFIFLESFSFMPPPTGVHVYNNTIYNKGDAFVNRAVAVTVQPNYTNVLVRNNYFALLNAVTAITIDDQTGAAVFSNNILAKTEYFTDPDNANPLLRNFSLTSSASNAIGQGYVVPVYDDFTGQSRNGAYDIGAIEYSVGGDTTPPAVPKNISVL